MKYTQEIGGASEETVGAAGAGKKDLSAALGEAKKAIGFLQQAKKSNSLPVLNLPELKTDIPAIEAAAKRITDHCDTLIVLGMGASGMGGNALTALARNAFTGLAGKLKMHFLDNIDPHTFGQLLAAVNLKTAMFLSISKSGGTAETMAQTLVLLREVESRIGKGAAKDRFIFITEPGDNVMRRLGSEHGIETLDHDPGIGGRFAALTAVGLVPAKAAGLNIQAIRHGAAEATRRMFGTDVPEPVMGAALHHALLAKGKVVSVIMPYCDRLSAFSAWHQQLWSESLGKDGHGTTALRALGAFDQHSQLQLYLDGPNDKFFTLVLLHQEHTGAAIPTPREKALGYLNGHTIGDLMVAEQRATVETLIRNKRPVRIISMDVLNEENLGALMMHFMLETMVTGHIWGIDTFSQPAVEEGKQLAREYLASDNTLKASNA